MKITGKKLLVFSLLLAVIVILVAILYYLSLTRSNNCEHHAVLWMKQFVYYLISILI